MIAFFSAEQLETVNKVHGSNNIVKIMTTPEGIALTATLVLKDGEEPPEHLREGIVKLGRVVGQVAITWSCESLRGLTAPLAVPAKDRDLLQRLAAGSLSGEQLGAARCFAEELAKAASAPNEAAEEPSGPRF